LPVVAVSSPVSKGLVAGGVALVLVSAVLFGLAALTQGGEAEAAPPVMPTTTPTVPSTEPTPRDVPAAAPTRLTIPSIGVDAPVSLYTVAQAEAGSDGVTGRSCIDGGVITCIDPPDGTTVSWQKAAVGGIAFGAEPGTDSDGTVYLFGHSSAAPGTVFDSLYKLKTGASALVTTSAGVLTYDVERVVKPEKGDYTSTPEAIDQVPGRLLLISCYHGPGAKTVNGGYSTQNVVAVLQLRGGTPNTGQ